MKSYKAHLVFFVLVIVTAQLILIAATGLAQHASTPAGMKPIDEDGCWDAPSSCISTTSTWWGSDEFISYYTNRLFPPGVYHVTAMKRPA